MAWSTGMSSADQTAAVNRVAASLRAVLGPTAVRPNQPLARYTTLHVGGPAELLAVVESVAALRQAVELAWDHGVPCRVLGAGSNVLVSDAGLRGVVILNRARAFSFADAQVRAASGALLSKVARESVARGLAGLEWATGIPGTVGGAVVGNAGAWGGDIASTLIRASVLGPDGVVSVWPVERFEYGYRTSTLKRQRACSEPQAIVLEAEFALRPHEQQALQARVAEITSQRRSRQPPGRSCGSVFKNPAGDYAGRLLDAAGVKGKRCGDAQISPMHANFVVNLGAATAADVEALIDHARRQVRAVFGVELEPEIELIGDWQERRRTDQRSEVTGQDLQNTIDCARIVYE